VERAGQSTPARQGAQAVALPLEKKPAAQGSGAAGDGVVTVGCGQ